MDAELKKTLKSVTLELRHLLEGRYDSAGEWQPGDLEKRLAAIGVRRDRASVPVDELGHLTEEDRHARRVADAYLNLREEAGVERSEAVAAFVRETAYTWANRLLALRCMEARELIDPVILQQEAYGGRSLEHHRLAQRSPELCAGEDDGLFAVLDKVFREQTGRLPMLFDPHAPGIALRPSPAALKDCFGLLSLNPETLRKHRIRQKEDERNGAEPPNPFTAPDALGWAYQYWNTEEKVRVFEKVRTVKGSKIAGADIVPATQLYTESYMVKFLVQNSLGATWMGTHPQSRLAEHWEYFVKDADRAPVEKKPVREITFLDPACGSGHFLLEAFDLFYAMYQEEGELTEPEAICDAILTRNLFGIDIDARSVQIAEAALWMKAAERAFDYAGAATNLVAATASHLKGLSWDEFLAGFEKEPSVARVLRKFAQTMEHIDEIGSLARPAEDLRGIIREEHATWERQVREEREANFLFPDMRAEALSGQLPFHEISDVEFGDRLFYRAKAAIDAFTQRARESGEFEDQLLGVETRTGFRLVDLLSRRYDVVAANPPYMGKRKQGQTIAKFLSDQYKHSSEDIYSAFLDRATHLTRLGGFVGFVTMFGYTCMPPFTKFRTLLLRDSELSLLAHVGTYAFQEMRDHVNGMLTILRAGAPRSDNMITVIRCDHESDKSLGLRNPVLRSTVEQGLFSRLPNHAFAFWFPEELLPMYDRHSRIDSLATVSLGLSAVDNARFYRRLWEVSSGLHRDWHPLMKGGQYDRWEGPILWSVRWRNAGANIKALMEDKYPYLNGNYNWKIHDEDLYFRAGVTYTNASCWGMGARVMPAGCLFDDTAPGILEMSIQTDATCALLNSHAFALYARLVNPSVHLQPGDVRSIPLPLPSTSESHSLQILGSRCRRTKEELLGFDMLSHSFRPAVYSRLFFGGSLVAQCEKIAIREIVLSALLAWCDGAANAFASRLTVGNEHLRRILEHVECPTGWLPVSREHIQRFLTEVISDEGERELVEVEGITGVQLNANGAATDELAWQARRQLESFGSTDTESDRPLDDSGDELEESDEVFGLTRVAPQSDVDLMARRGNVNPVVLGLLAWEGDFARTKWVQSRFPAYVATLLTTLSLGLLGHRWPKQLEAGELVPDWADPDGIIPITSLANELTLFERVQERLRAEEIDESDFAEVMGKPLDAWLATEFFKHHTKQFKKRPIAWQLQSGKFTARKSPAFACLVYYHKLDADTLPKIRSQYVGPLRQRLETELRGIQTIPADSRSDRQEKRRIELEDAITELTAFDAKLDQVSRGGFSSPGLAKLLADEPLDRWCSLDGKRPHPTTTTELIAQESAYAPDINDGVRVNIAPLQKAGLLAADALAKKDVDKAIADRAQWRADERRWVREGKLPQPGWWPEETTT